MACADHLAAAQRHLDARGLSRGPVLDQRDPRAKRDLLLIMRVLIADRARRAPEQRHRRQMREAELHLQARARRGDHARAELELADVHRDPLDLICGKRPRAHQLAQSLDRGVGEKA